MQEEQIDNITQQINSIELNDNIILNNNIQLNMNYDNKYEQNIKSLNFLGLKEKLYAIINKNDYIQNCSSNKEIDKNSLSYLIKNISLSQSDKIKLGIGIEKILREFIIEENKELENIKEKNKKNVKEKDHLFEHKKNKIIYYAELKSNLDLDTEKLISTINKCYEIQEELKKKYEEYEIKMYLVSLRFLEKKDIPEITMKKLDKINQNVIGINDYLKILKIINFNNENEYKEILYYLVKEMFNKK